MNAMKFLRVRKDTPVMEHIEPEDSLEQVDTEEQRRPCVKGPNQTTMHGKTSLAELAKK